MDRREFLWAGGAVLAGCAGGAEAVGNTPVAMESAGMGPLDALLAAHADVRPELAGAGANHDPMAAEALAALGASAAIPVAWRRRAASYAGPLPRCEAIEVPTTALGDARRYGDWLDYFRGALASGSWQAVLIAAVPWLASGVVGAAWHGVIRTAHAVRALRERDVPVRRGELAAGLAYWASAHAELRPPPTDATPIAATRLLAAAQQLVPARCEVADIAFGSVTGRLTVAALPVVDVDVDPAAAIRDLVADMVLVLQEMLALEHQRIWMLHAVTGPAAVGLLLPELPGATARQLVGHTCRGALATCAAFGGPFTPRAHVVPRPAEWPTLIAEAVSRQSVHTIKLLEVLRRCDDGGDPRWRSVAEAWLAWR